jgi:ferritin-like metal-binding protein YciE
MTLSTLNHQLIGTLRDLYAVESQLTKAIPRVLEAASSEELKSLLRKLHEESEQHVEGLDRCAKSLQERLSGERSRPVDALIRDALNLADSEGNEWTIDLGFLNILRHIEHYEMAGYEYARSLAEVLDEGDVRDLLDAILRAEEAAEQALTVLAHDMKDTVVAQTLHDLSVGRPSAESGTPRAEKADFESLS